MMAGFEDFGSELLTKDGLKPANEVLAGKAAVAVYFSAHWCPPCRKFTPQLAEWHRDSLKQKGLEIIFVSSDKDQAGFDDYYKDMPFAALPWTNREAKNKLSKKFKVQGIPCLVILGPDGKMITKDGREAVCKDPKGEKLPWSPPSAAEKAKMLLDNLGPELVEKVAGKPFGIYFSAHWCPPCRRFTPELAQLYKDGLKEKMEIIFVSSDKSKEEFDEYLAQMPWLALPYEKRAEKDALSDACGVQGIPSFQIFNPDGTVITADGRSQVGKDPKGEQLPDGWKPQPFGDISEGVKHLNEEQCLLILNGSESAIASVKQVAEKHYADCGKNVDDMKMRFFSAPSGEELTSRIEQLTKTQGQQLVLLDIPDEGGFYQCDTADISVETIDRFLAAVNKTVPRKQLSRG